jgi:hypothetical protein
MQPDVAWTLLEGRPEETVDFAEVEFTPGDWPKSALPLRYVALRISPCQTSLFFTTPKYLAVGSNRWHMSAEASALALGEGRYHRVDARCDQEQTCRCGSYQRQVRR